MSEPSATTPPRGAPTPCAHWAAAAAAATPKMAAALTPRQLYGGAITMSYPPQFADVSPFRDVPDHQEVWTDGHDNTCIVELLDLKADVPSEDAGAFFFGDLAAASDAADATLLGTGILVPDMCPGMSAGPLEDTVERLATIGVHVVAKFREEEKSGPSARNRVMVYLANFRLHNVGTDMLVTMYRTVKVGETSSSTTAGVAANTDCVETAAAGMGAGLDEDGAAMPGLSEFACMIRTLAVQNWGLFG